MLNYLFSHHKNRALVCAKIKIEINLKIIDIDMARNEMHDNVSLETQKKKNI